MTYVDGKSEVIASDGSWKVTRGPVVFSSIYGGEDYDARKDLAGWDGVAFNDAAWDGAKIVDGGGARLIPALAPEVVESAEHKPVKVAQVGPDKTVYDLGQNFAGVSLDPGTRCSGRDAEADSRRVAEAGRFGQPGKHRRALCGGAIPSPDRAVPKSGSRSSTTNGFRYVQAEWSTDRPAGKLEELAGHEWHSASKITGSFENSNATLNAIHKLIVEAMHNNEVSIFTDCPHREKLGWDEETHLVAPGLIFNNDLRGLYAATGLNFADAQHADGNMPTIVPQYTVFGGKSSVYDDSPEWGSAAILAPWAAYRFYGDRAQLERDYPVMQRYLAYLKTRAVDGIVAYGLGDWYDIGPGNPGFSKLTTLGVTGTLMLYQDAVVMQKIAALLGKPADAVGYGHIAEDEKKAFNARFWDSTNGYYDKGSQTAQAVPLALGLVPDDAKARLLDYLVADIHAHQDHITTGEVGFPYLLRTLMENGRNDVLLAVLLRKDPPSYASQLAAGATALTEAWDANPRSSQDHFMLGGAEEWFYRGLGGIDFDQSRGDPATRITIHPQMVAGIDWVRCGYDSVLGHIQSDWRKSATGGALDITIPPNSQATVILPDGPQVVGPGRHHFTLKPTP